LFKKKGSLQTVSGSTALHYLMQQPLYKTDREDVTVYFAKKNEANWTQGPPRG
jgi:hypothetical protein